MDVVLIAPFPLGARGINEATISPPLGLGYIAAVLKQKGYECKIIDANILRMNNKLVLQDLKQYSPSLIGISMNVITTPSGIELIRMIKDNFSRSLVIIGGPFPTSLPKETLRTTRANAVVLGEGEYTILEIIERLKKGEDPFYNTKGIYYMKNGEIIVNEARPRIQDLDLLPFPDYDEFPNIKLYKSRARKFPIGWLFTSRGCPYECGYCFKGIFGREIIYHSPQRVLNEIEYLVRNYGVKQIDILDDNFAIDIERTDEILDGLIEGNFDLVINLQNGISIENINRKILKKMRRAGVYRLGIGVESGDERILLAMRKKIRLENVLEVTAMAREEGISVSGFFIMGYPTETEESLRKTISFAKKMNPNVANFSIALPFPGTLMYKMIEAKGKFLVNIKRGFLSGFTGHRAIFSYGNLKARDIVKFYRKAYLEFYLRPYKIIDIFKEIKSLTELEWFISAGWHLVFSNLKPRLWLCPKIW